MTEFVDKRAGWVRRTLRVLRSWEQALDHSPYDYVIDRVGALEQEVRALRAEVSRLRTDRTRPETVRS